LGSIVLGSGSKFTLSFNGDQLLNFSVDAPAQSGGNIKNTGTLLADGGKILVTANAAQSVVDSTIDMEGIAQRIPSRKVKALSFSPMKIRIIIALSLYRAS